LQAGTVARYKPRMARKPRRGRPVSENPASEKLEIRCTPAEKSAWRAAAGVQKLSAWARALLNAAAQRPG